MSHIRWVKDGLAIQHHYRSLSALAQSRPRYCIAANAALGQRTKSLRSSKNVKTQSGADFFGAQIPIACSAAHDGSHRRKTWFNPSGRPSLPTPGEHQARRDTVATRNFSHLPARRPRLLDNPRLIILRPALTPLQPAQNLHPHRLITLKLDLRSHASRIITRHTRRCSSELVGCVHTNSISHPRFARVTFGFMKYQFMVYPLF
jgi:hypothetical protein